MATNSILLVIGLRAKERTLLSLLIILLNEAKTRWNRQLSSAQLLSILINEHELPLNMPSNIIHSFY